MKQRVRKRKHSLGGWLGQVSLGQVVRRVRSLMSSQFTVGKFAWLAILH